MQKLLFLSIGILMYSNLLFSQDNLVPNPSFDEPKKGKTVKVKEAEMIDVLKGWTSPTVPKADVFTKVSKEETFSMPANMYGREEADEGCCYVGIVAFAEKDKQPRTYIQAELTAALGADSFYCVKYNVSLADLSKYAVNNVGALLTSKPADLNGLKSYTLIPQIMLHSNKVIDEQYMFEPVCAMYKATGGEKFITLGNFAASSATTNVKVKKPKAFTQQQFPIAYYYVEGVSITLTDSLKGCGCKDQETKKEVNIVYHKTESDDVTADPAKMAEYKIIYFPSKASAVSDEAKKLLDEVVVILKENANAKVNIVAQTDKEEEALMTKSKINLSLKRADAVAKYLVEEGIEKDRLVVKAIKDSQSKVSKDPNLLKEDRKVYFQVIK